MLDHSKLKSLVSRAADMTEEDRKLAERDRDYYNGYQWTSEEMAILKRRKQPIITKNRIKRKIDAMVGIEQRGRTDPIAYPRNPADEDAADVATKVLRYIEEEQEIDQIGSEVFFNLAIEGYGGAEVIAEERHGQIEVVVNRLRWEEIFYDPYSREKDFSDAQYLGTQKWMSEDAALEYLAPMWEGDEAGLTSLLDSQTTELGDTYADRPLYEQQMAWVDPKLRRVRVAQMYYRYNGQWMLYVFTGRGTIYEGPSPYVDEHGDTVCPMILQSAYIDRENGRFGVVRDMISAQDEINKRSSKMLHGINSRQTVAIKGALDSISDFKREIASPDGHIELNIEAFEDAARVGMKPFDILPTNDQLSGQAAMLQEAKNEIDMFGPNPALLGMEMGAVSGRAIMAQQQAGLAELAPLYDGNRNWKERVYKACWNRIRQFWDAPRWIRITDDDQSPEFVAINQPEMLPDGTMGIRNPVAQMDVDIIIATSPEYATLRHEQFEKLVDLARSGFPIPPQVIIEASDLHDKRKLLEAMQPPPEQQAMQAQMQQIDMQMKLQGAQAELAKTQSTAARNMAAAQKDAAQAQLIPLEARKRQTEAAENMADTQYRMEEARKTRFEADRIAHEQAMHAQAMQEQEMMRRVALMRPAVGY